MKPAVRLATSLQTHLRNWWRNYNLYLPLQPPVGYNETVLFSAKQDLREQVQCLSGRSGSRSPTGIWTRGSPRSRACISNLGQDANPDSPCSLFLQLGAEQQVGEEEDVTEFPGTFDQLHHEAIPQQLAVLPMGNGKSPRHYSHSI